MGRQQGRPKEVKVQGSRTDWKFSRLGRGSPEKKKIRPLDLQNRTGGGKKESKLFGWENEGRGKQAR